MIFKNYFLKTFFKIIVYDFCFHPQFSQFLVGVSVKWYEIHEKGILEFKFQINY